jgi:hypothetical protein
MTLRFLNLMYELLFERFANLIATLWAPSGIPGKCQIDPVTLRQTSANWSDSIAKFGSSNSEAWA